MRFPHLILVALLTVGPAVWADAMVGDLDDFTLSHSWVGNVENTPCGSCGFPPFLCLCPPAGSESGAFRVLDGGPNGLLDAYLRVEELPSFGLETWNTAADRTGDYSAAGIGAVGVSLRNFGGSPLKVRLGVRRGSTRWVTSTAEAFPLPGSSGWLNEIFLLQESQMTRVSGSGSLASVLADVDEIRLLHASNAQWSGGGGGPLGIDNVAFPEPSGAAPLAACLALLALLTRRRA